MDLKRIATRVSGILHFPKREDLPPGGVPEGGYDTRIYHLPPNEPDFLIVRHKDNKYSLENYKTKKHRDPKLLRREDLNTVMRLIREVMDLQQKAILYDPDIAVTDWIRQPKKNVVEIDESDLKDMTPVD